MKYNLTFRQKLSLPFTFLFWITTPKEKRKTWHEVKKGMEPHQHNFTIPILTHLPYKFLQCDHIGCNECIDVTIYRPLLHKYLNDLKKNETRL